jgi:hypothetical protein
VHCAPSCYGGCWASSARVELPLRVESLDAAVDAGLLLGSIHHGGIHSGSRSLLMRQRRLSGGRGIGGVRAYPSKCRSH